MSGSLLCFIDGILEGVRCRSTISHSLQVMTVDGSSYSDMQSIQMKITVNRPRTESDNLILQGRLEMF